MNLHSRLIGAIDAVFLVLSALVMMALLSALIEPGELGRMADAAFSAERQKA